MTGRTVKVFLCAAMLTWCAVQAGKAQAGKANAGPAQTPTSSDGVAVRNFRPETYGAGRQNWATVEDDRGIRYFGNESGVLEFDGARWRLIRLPGNRAAYSLAKGADGRILVGSDGEAGWLEPDQAGTMIYRSKAADLPEEFRSQGDRVIRILDTPAGQVFLADRWLFVRPGNGTFKTLRSSGHFLQAAWFNGALLVLDSERGLTRLEDGALKEVTGGEHLRGLAMAETGAGLLIPSYSDGLVMYAPSSSNPVQVLHLNGWSAEDDADVTSAVALSKDLVAFGTARHGVAVIDLRTGMVQRIGNNEGLADAHVTSVSYDHRGGLWLALENGAALVSLNLPRDAETAPFRSWVRNVVGTHDDHLYFGGAFFASMGGVQQLIQSGLQKLEFPHQTDAFRFDYSANGLTANGGMEFQTYMQGADTGWSNWSGRTEREFTSLQAGHWVFRVRARQANGEVSQEGTYELTIRPAWYRTFWFTGLQVLCVIAILLLPGHTPHQRLQEALTTFAVIVPFVYLGNWLGDLVTHYYSSEVAFLNVLVSSLLAFALDPLQGGLKELVIYRNKRRAERKAKRALHEHQ
jgi:hypothetical protein